jgi:transcription antitermination factor NusG
MMRAQGKLLSEIKASRFVGGDMVDLLQGPFKGFEAEVVSVTGDKIKVKIKATLLGSPIEMTYIESQIEHKSELRNIEIQDI